MPGSRTTASSTPLTAMRASAEPLNILATDLTVFPCSVQKYTADPGVEDAPPGSYCPPVYPASQFVTSAAPGWVPSRRTRDQASDCRHARGGSPRIVLVATTLPVSADRTRTVR